MDDHFTISATTPAPESTVRAAGELDLSARDELRRVLLDLVADDRVRRVVVDLAGVTFIDSESIGAIFDGHLAATEAGKTLLLHNVNGLVRRVFEIIGMDKLMGIKATKSGQ